MFLGKLHAAWCKVFDLIFMLHLSKSPMSIFTLTVFGELSKKLAEVWKQLPEKDKLVCCLFSPPLFYFFPLVLSLYSIYYLIKEYSSTSLCEIRGEKNMVPYSIFPFSFCRYGSKKLNTCSISRTKPRPQRSSVRVQPAMAAKAKVSWPYLLIIMCRTDILYE